MNRLLLVEDHEGVRRTCKRLMKGRHQIDEAENVARARELIDAHAYERAVFDVHLPDGDGLELLEWARRAGKRFPVLVMTGETDRRVASRAFLLGAQLVFKPIDPAVLRQFAGGPSALSPARRQCLDDNARAYAAANNLSARQTDLLLALARGVARRGLAHELQIEENTIKTMVKHILERTGLHSMDAIVCLLLETAAQEEGSDARSASVDVGANGGGEE